jgi:DNA-binding NarL/FixJ family response regulator
MHFSKNTFENMSATEKIILQLAASGQQNGDIARKTGLNPVYVSSVKGRLIRKFKAGRFKKSARTKAFTIAASIGKRAGWL